MTTFQCAAAALITALTVSCARSAGTDEEPLTPASNVQQDPVVESESQEPRELQACQSDDECAAGYTCGYDPEISQVVRYCMQL